MSIDLSLSRPRASERVEAFRFEASDCLYRDCQGRRVVADWEGGGRLSLVRSDVELQWYGVLGAGEMFPLPIADLAVVTAIEDGTVELIAGQVPEELPDGLMQTGSAIQGMGWVVSAEAPLEIDGSNEPVPPPVPNFPIPFFRSARSSLPMRAAVAVIEPATLLLRLDMGEPAGWAAAGWAVRNASRPAVLESCFADGTPHVGWALSHLNRAEWEVDVPAGATGLILRKLYDRFHGRQRARVLVDGRPVGMWHLPRQDRGRRWAWGQFGWDGVSPGRRRIGIDPPAGVPLWSVSQVEVWAVF